MNELIYHVNSVISSMVDDANSRANIWTENCSDTLKEFIALCKYYEYLVSEYGERKDENADDEM